MQLGAPSFLVHVLINHQKYDENEADGTSHHFDQVHHGLLVLAQSIDFVSCTARQSTLTQRDIDEEVQAIPPHILHSHRPNICSFVIIA